jgi:hypothetical protein
VELGQRQFGSVAPAGIACGVSYSQQLRQLLQTWQALEMRRWVLLLLFVYLVQLLVLRCDVVVSSALPGAVYILLLLFLVLLFWWSLG